MCGIIGYIGPKPAYPFLIKGLHRLEYRGYDSAGLALVGSTLAVCKRKGKVAELERAVGGGATTATLGIGHTRWATHGPPNEVNAHPHLSESKRLALVHNGIIENYATLKAELTNRGHHFVSETDTEVLAHLIEDVQRSERVGLAEAVRIALRGVVGAYAIAVVSQDEPDVLVAARKGSPLVVGVGEGEFFLASDATPIVEYTKNVVYLEDGDVAVLPRQGELSIKTIENQSRTPYIQTLELQLEALAKGGFEHFMLKEIFEQPRSIQDSMRGRLDPETGRVTLGGLGAYADKFLSAKRLIVVACGTSWHAGLVAEHLFEDLANIPTEVEYASEFRYRNPLVYKDNIVLAISQSGETADTLAAIELAKVKGATVLGVCNVVGSSIARATMAGCYTHAGPEIGVASTKAFTAQVTVLALMALSIAQRKGTIAPRRFQQLVRELSGMPEKVAAVLQTNDQVRQIAGVYRQAPNAIYLGRGYGFPVALEGALKLKEVSYVHAEGYPAAEMKHGPIALVDEAMPVVVISTSGPSYEKMVSNIQEIRARKGRVISVVTQGDTLVPGLSEYSIEVPESDEVFSPLLTVVPLQLLAYHVAVMHGCNVDQPRNLAKSVTVE